MFKTYQKTFFTTAAIAFILSCNIAEATEILGEVKEVSGEKITINIEGKLAPKVGDLVTVTLEHEVMGAMEVGTWTVSQVAFPKVTATLKEASGEAQTSMQAIIHSVYPVEVAIKEEAVEAIVHPDTEFGELEKLIMEGAGINDPIIVMEGIANGGNVNAGDENGAFPLAVAAREGHMEIIDLLLGAGANPNLESPDRGQTALKLAAKKGRNSVILTLLEAGADINFRGGKYRYDLSESPALFFATSKGHVNTVKLLLEQGADPYIENRYGITAIAAAAQEGHIDVINAFVEAGMPLDYVSSTGITPLMAATTGVNNWETMAYLIGGGANVNAQILPIPKGKDLDPKTEGITSLMWAVDDRDPRAFFFLLQAGADPRLKDVTGQTAASMLEKEIKRNTSDKNLTKKFREMQRALKDPVWGRKHAQEVIDDRLKRTVRDNNVLIAAALLNMGADPNLYVNDDPLLLEAVNERSFPMVKLLIDRGATPNATDEDGISPFLQSLTKRRGSPEMARYMLEHGADPHYVPPETPFTLLHALAMQGLPDLVPDIVKAGVDVDARFEENGNTPLHFAAEEGNLDAFKALLAAGANPSLKNKDSKTALDLVSKSKRQQFATSLP